MRATNPIEFLFSVSCIAIGFPQQDLIGQLKLTLLINLLAVLVCLTLGSLLVALRFTCSTPCMAIAETIAQWFRVRKQRRRRVGSYCDVHPQIRTDLETGKGDFPRHLSSPQGRAVHHWFHGGETWKRYLAPTRLWSARLTLRAWLGSMLGTEICALVLSCLTVIVAILAVCPMPMSIKWASDECFSSLNLHRRDKPLIAEWPKNSKMRIELIIAGCHGYQSSRKRRT